MAATSFSLFMYLPFELRARVWELTAEPRTVDLDLLYRQTTRTDFVAAGYRVSKRNVEYLTPIPSIVQVCREARQLGIYRQLFCRLVNVRDGGERRYVWLNLKLDIVDAGRAPLESLIPVAASIRQLKFMRGKVTTEDMLCLGQCVNLKELHIDSPETYSPNFYQLFKKFPLHCGMENIFMVDALLGLVPPRAEWAFRGNSGRFYTARTLHIIELDIKTRGIQWGLRGEAASGSVNL